MKCPRNQPPKVFSLSTHVKEASHRLGMLESITCRLALEAAESAKRHLEGLLAAAESGNNNQDAIQGEARAGQGQ